MAPCPPAARTSSRARRRSGCTAACPSAPAAPWLPRRCRRWPRTGRSPRPTGPRVGLSGSYERRSRRGAPRSAGSPRVGRPCRRPASRRCWAPSTRRRPSWRCRPPRAPSRGAPPHCPASARRARPGSRRRRPRRPPRPPRGRRCRPTRAQLTHAARSIRSWTGPPHRWSRRTPACGRGAADVHRWSSKISSRTPSGSGK